MDISNDIDKILTKIIVGLTEFALIILTSALSIFASVLVFFLRGRVYKLLAYFGLNYFEERNKMIRDINSDLLFCQGALRADTYALFRTFNGKAYLIEDNDTMPHITGRKDAIKENAKIKVRKINSKPEDFFPKELEYEIYKSIINHTIANDWQLISYDSIRNENPKTELLIFLEANGIDHLLSFKIWDMDKKTFGMILFTWSRKPDLENLFDRNVSKKLDSISIRFQNYIVSSLMEKIFNARIVNW
jgi:hypothetical protein